ncbi:Fe-S protein assembly co-chaperone HscB [Candidatus Vallotiella sp. (ex Adelges kitamiensis)]|uniref:Fe-S protein assembly co-chaperone HscB n=1 Tax=Candidatus Vallotiella sp. (ex Adelges kitamiensis) TaxID=2864217 RepID=UPI001CE3996D|nr:Fe-S protein assembly co-chaperone HscB [Candidatus Vallotia sp. (ex Adelges kitamiensis)]
MLSLTQNHFEFFQLPERFGLDAHALAHAYRSIQAQVHPDRFASADYAQKCIATQWATRVNEVYQTLKSPLRRATYLLHLRGIEVGAENNTVMEPTFLIHQIEWREKIEHAAAASNNNALQTLLYELRNEESERLVWLGEFLDSDANQLAAELVRQLMFIERVIYEIDIQIEKIELVQSQLPNT